MLVPLCSGPFRSQKQAFKYKSKYTQLGQTGILRGAETLVMATKWVETLNRKLSHCNVKTVPGREAVYLQATLPCKTEPSKYKQQQIATGLKVSHPSTRETLQALAFRLDGQLELSTFSWSDWSKDKITAKKGSTPRESILFSDLWEGVEARFDAYYPDKPKTGAGIYTSKYKPTISLLRKFYGSADLEAICQVIKDIESPSSRENFGSIISVTLDHMELTWDKKPLFAAKKGYTISQLTERDIPSDDELLAIWSSIKDPRWKWVHGMSMAFGTRPSELLSVEFEDDVINLMTYKTKGKPYSREAWALPEEWIEELNLREMHKPTCNRLNVARQYSDYMERNNLKHWPLYNLRHAYAIRSLVKGIEISMAARLMGHTESTHRKHYQLWISKKDMRAMRERQRDKFKRA